MTQKFVDAVIVRFQNINPEKEGKNVTNETHVRNEIQMITLPDRAYGLWSQALQAHMQGLLVNPATGKPHREDKPFNLKNHKVRREFFKHLGHLSDKDLEENAVHIVSKTPGRTLPYP